VSSSDLELARALSRLLSELPAGAPLTVPPSTAAAVEPPDPSRFVRLPKPAPPGVSDPGEASGTRS
jgi:hypothetical protein